MCRSGWIKCYPQWGAATFKQYPGPFLIYYFPIVLCVKLFANEKVFMSNIAVLCTNNQDELTGCLATSFKATPVRKH